MKAFVLFLVRIVTGASLIAWSAAKVLDTPAAIQVSDQLYMGYASTPVAQHGLAALGAVLGVFVILGFLKTFSYSVQFIVLLVAAVALARVNVVLPVELASGVASATLLLPSIALALLALSLIVWLKDDFFALDGFINFRKKDLAQDAVHAAALSAPVAAAVAHEEPAHDDHGHDAAPVHAEPVHEAHAHEEHAHEEPAHEEPAHGHDDHGHAPHGEEPHAVHAEPAHEEHGHDDHGHHAEPAHDDHAKAHHAH
ncbi:MAG: hypothetical protein Q7T44_02935 [Parvibaculum sp.]|nr:hypothetical protein [Parvibaculum sp.]